MTISPTKSIIPDRPPDQVNIYQVKKVSGKYSWTEHESAKSADKQTKRTNNGWYWKTHGRLWRFRYRINIYLKDKDVSN